MYFYEQGWSCSGLCTKFGNEYIFLNRNLYLFFIEMFLILMTIIFLIIPIRKVTNVRFLQCVVQCFFNELNLVSNFSFVTWTWIQKDIIWQVDHRGFPERMAVTGIMTRNIIDPELRDFIEQAIIECYHYINTNYFQDKCQFSQNLLTCLAEKGSEVRDSIFSIHLQQH